jgi:polyisoprenoid-binding protein YceI
VTATLPTTAGTWTVSDSRTRVGFAVGNLGSRAHGSVTCSWGEVRLDDEGSPVRARAHLDLESLDTGIDRRDRDLRKPRWLDIDRNPLMTWTCDRFLPAPDGGWTAEGQLQVRGTSAPLALLVQPEVGGQDGSWVRVRASGVIDRRSVGIRAPSFLIGREVAVTIDAWLTRR